MLWKLIRWVAENVAPLFPRRGGTSQAWNSHSVSIASDASKQTLRVFDCKTETCQDIISHAPKILDYLCNECEQHFAGVKSSLADLGISYQINPKMVRGLDYYARTAFEVTSGTGAQNAIAGGGRYDGLVSFLGGPEVAGIGFAAGMERLVACWSKKMIVQLKQMSTSPHLVQLR